MLRFTSYLYKEISKYLRCDKSNWTTDICLEKLSLRMRADFSVRTYFSPPTPHIPSKAPR